MKKRIISSIILFIIALPLMIIGGNIFYIGVSLLALESLIEIIKAKENEKKLPIIIIVLSILSFILILTHDWFDYINIALEHELILVLFLIIMPIVAYKKKETYSIIDALFMFGSIMLIAVGFNSLALLRINNSVFFIYVVLVAIITDTFAYAAGSLIGKHKMCPSISPNKTWEGFLGGLIMASIVCTIVLKSLSNIPLMNILLITILLSIIGTIGDLSFSTIKRFFKIKDFGKIIEGHGGVLDSFDSLIFISLAFSLISRFL